MNRPCWHNYLLGLALVVSKRSHDAQTQHGCVIVDSKFRILGTGYNGFPRGMVDQNLPNTRPEKYDWMIHSEVNAVTNCIIRPENATAYVTGEPCNNCLFHLWNNGVTKVIYADRHGSYLINDQTRNVRERFLRDTQMGLVVMKADLSWLKDITNE